MVDETDIFEALERLELAKPPLKPSLSAQFQSYETLLEKIKLTCKEDAFDIAWEEDTDDELENEELVGFRQDLDLPRENVHAATEPTINNTIATTGALLASASDFAATNGVSDTSEVNEPQSTCDLEEFFHKELTKATIKADFDERYIQSSLERRRLGLPPDEAVSTWKQSIQANPLTTLENISRSVLLEKRIESEEFELGTIKELEDDSVPVEIAQSSQKYSNFLPLDAPILDLIGFDM